MRFSATVRGFAALAVATAMYLPAQGHEATTVFHIPAKPMADALVDFAVQAGVSISDSGVSVANAASNPIDGRFTREEGLRRLLAGSGFAYRFVAANSVQIVVAPRQALPPPQSAGVERVVVTATKLDEVAETAPHSVAVALGDQMQAFHVEGTHDLTTEFAGLTATNLGPGEDKLFVRGLTDSVLPGLSESVVGVYMDDSPIAADAPDPNLRLVDVDRVEVLRGPQGSLYGAGALTGLVRIVTREPVFDAFELSAGGDASLTFGGTPSESAQVVINLPLIENELAVRIAAYTDTLGGYVNELRFQRKDTNETRIGGLRAAAAWQPVSEWTLSAHVAYQRTRSDDSQYYDENLGADKRDNFLYEPHSDGFLLASLTAKGTLGRAELTSNTAFVNREFRDRFDATLAWPQLTGLPLGPSPFDYARSIRAFTHETRLSSTEDATWQWVLGIFLSHEDEDFRSTLFGPGPDGTIVNGRSEAREDRTNDAAVFGQMTYNFSEELSISAGARAFDASHNVSAQVSGLLAATPQFRGSNSQQGFAPQLTIAYRPNYNATFYVGYSEGYRLGGLNVDGPQNASGENEPTFDSDTLRNFEAGAKLRFFGGRVLTNAAVYFAEWRNVQTDQIASDGAFYILNAGDVRDLGAELEGSAEVLPNLHLSGNVFWNNPGFTDTNPLLVTTEGSLPGAPAVSFGISARYDHRLSADADAFAALEYSYVGSSHLGFSETSPPMGNYQLMNLRLGILRGHWQAIVFAENLTNDRGNTFAFGNPFSLPFERQITPPRPRTIGISLDWNMQQ